MRSITPYDSPPPSFATGAAGSRLAAEHDGRLRTLLAIAVMLLAFALGSKLTATWRDRQTGPVRLTSYETQQLEEVRYALWLDQARRAGETSR